MSIGTFSYPRGTPYREYDTGILVALTPKIINHALGRYPARVVLFLECINRAGSLGWAFGDRVKITPSNASGASRQAFSVGTNTANVYIVPGGDGAPSLNNKTTFTPAALTYADWKLFVRIYP